LLPHSVTALHDRIRSLEVVGPIMPYIDRPRPATGLEGKFSVQYAAAVAVLDGAVGIDTFTDDHCLNSAVTAILTKTRFLQSPEIPAALDRMWVEVKIELEGDNAVTAKCTSPPGAWGTPISEPDHMIKVRDCMRLVLNESETRGTISSLQNFESLDHRAVQAVMDTLRHPPQNGTQS
jgi:2-methylcitrate dehydratase PrpD